MIMKVLDSKFYRWLFSTPYRALHRAYEASKKVRNIQRDYLFYKNTIGDSSKRSFYNVTLYIDSILNQSASTIFWSLVEFKISINLCNFLASLTPRSPVPPLDPFREDVPLPPPSYREEGGGKGIQQIFALGTNRLEEIERKNLPLPPLRTIAHTVGPEDQRANRPSVYGREVLPKEKDPLPTGSPVSLPGVPNGSPQRPEVPPEDPLARGTSKNIYTRSLKQKLNNWMNFFTGWKNKNYYGPVGRVDFNYYAENLSFTSSIEKNCFFLNKIYNKNLDWERWNRKLTWIEAVLIDLEVLKNIGWFSPLASLEPLEANGPASGGGPFGNPYRGQDTLSSSGSSVGRRQRDQHQYTSLKTPYANDPFERTSLHPYRDFIWDRWSRDGLQRPLEADGLASGGTEKLKDTVRWPDHRPLGAYESLGLVPRSITRTLSRFQTELAGRSASLVLPEFRLAKYQAITSLKYLAFLILCPWIVLVVFKILFLEPLIENWWNTAQFQIFLSFSQEEKALKRLQQVEELLWLDIIMADSSAKQPQDLSAQIHQRTIDLVETYNQESIQTILHFFTNFIFIFVFISLLIFGKKRLAILNSWVQEVFYSLSDTMKAFFILLFTDLCIGFHSPHGWEILIGFILEHLGFSHNKHVISCFVSTFPVILDTVFKYWIFRHLNRISPSIVVSYHTMNE